MNENYISVDDLMDGSQHKILECFHHSTLTTSQKATQIAGLLCWTCGYAAAKQWTLSQKWLSFISDYIGK